MVVFSFFTLGSEMFWEYQDLHPSLPQLQLLFRLWNQLQSLCVSSCCEVIELLTSSVVKQSLLTVPQKNISLCMPRVSVLEARQELEELPLPAATHLFQGFPPEQAVPGAWCHPCSGWEERWASRFCVTEHLAKLVNLSLIPSFVFWLSWKADTGILVKHVKKAPRTCHRQDHFIVLHVFIQKSKYM